MALELDDLSLLEVDKLVHSATRAHYKFLRGESKHYGAARRLLNKARLAAEKLGLDVGTYGSLLDRAAYLYRDCPSTDKRS